MPMERFDIIVVGGGPNGLTSAAYLRRAGASVVVLDKRFELGGTMTTDDFSTPFYYNLCQYTLPMDETVPAYADLQLRSRYAVSLRYPDPVAAFIPSGGGEPLVIRRDGSGLSAGLVSMLDEAERAVKPLLYLPPAPVEETEAALEQGGARNAVELARLPISELVAREGDSRARALIRYLCGTLGFVDGEQPLGLAGVFCLARALRPSVVTGGTAVLARGLLRAGAASGVKFRNVADVTRIDPGDGEVRARCRDGREFAGRAVVCALDPKTVFLELLDAGAVPDSVRTAVGAWRLDSVGSFIAHFGIRGEPPRGGPGDAGDALLQVIGFEDEAAVARHLDHAAHGRLPDSPAGHLAVTSRHDPSLAAPGPYGPLHTLRFETIAPPVRADGAWTRENTASYRSECLDFLRATTTGLDAARVLTSFSDSPHDLERRFRTVRNGSVRQGRITRSQTFSARPHPDSSSGRTPIRPLYLAGGGVHPGVPGSLGGGYNAASAVCEDIGDLVRWWPEPAFVQQARDAGLMPERTAAGVSRGFRRG